MQNKGTQPYALIKSNRFILVMGICFLFSSCITLNQISDTAQDSNFIDSVCGMETDSTSQFRTEFNGKRYYFDSSECQMVFLKNPQKFAGGEIVHHSAKRNNSANHMGMADGASALLVMVAIMTTMIIFGVMH
jgi:YHS domain-containing protein